ncbi:hypothetical protein Anas_09438 [Armadillidium nasatum]|uniref:Uncharacterized protein n=1 Tax=Armadillidium nasatum TaxID=96803 RepID=A0A5N5SSD4_9CRUS|nr:hypothetical protein Anas_09438 [Armadillidium nasatum]
MKFSGRGGGGLYYELPFRRRRYGTVRMPPSKKKLARRKNAEHLHKRRYDAPVSQSEKVEEPPMKDVNLESKDEERVEKDLESCPHSEDGLNLGLNLSDNDEINENKTLNSVKKRKKIIEEFDKDLLNQGNIANEEDNDHYVLMQKSQLGKLIGESTCCRSCGGRDFKIEKAKGKYNLSTPFYTLKCCNEDCGLEASMRACPTKYVRGKEVSDIIARFSMINANMGVGYKALASIFTAFNLPVPSLNPDW